MLEDVPEHLDVLIADGTVNEKQEKTVVVNFVHKVLTAKELPIPINETELEPAFLIIGKLINHRDGLAEKGENNGGCIYRIRNKRV